MSIPDKHLREQYINSDGSRAFAADQSMGSNKLTNLAAPTTDNDAARKVDVDTAKEGLDAKDSVRVATVVAGTLASDFENGDTIDGVVLGTGDRILIKNQAVGTDNGIYTVNASGAPTRTDDFASGTTVAGAIMTAEGGSANADKRFLVTNNIGSDVVGVDALSFIQYGNEFSDGGEARGANRTLGNADSFDLAFITDNLQRLIVRANGDVEAFANFIVGSNTKINSNSFFVRTVVAGITASTTQTQGQGPLTGEINEVAVVANVNDTITLPTAVAGIKVIVANNGANALQIFPASGDDLGSGVDTADTIGTGKVVTFVAIDATNWVQQKGA